LRITARASAMIASSRQPLEIEPQAAPWSATAMKVPTARDVLPSKPVSVASTTPCPARSQASA
jgi:hypothetical protein